VRTDRQLLCADRQTVVVCGQTDSCCVRTDRQLLRVDRQRDMNKLIVTFHSFVYTPKK